MIDLNDTGTTGACMAQIQYNNVTQITLPTSGVGAGVARSSYYVHNELLKTDVMIVVPAIKNHDKGTITQSLKMRIGTAPQDIYFAPWLGCADEPFLRWEMHNWNQATKWPWDILGRTPSSEPEAVQYSLVDLNLVRPHDFTVVDALVGCEAGPLNYDEPTTRVKSIMASKDALAIDSIGALVMGYNPDQIPCLNMANDTQALGVKDRRLITVVGSHVKNVRVDFRLDHPVGYATPYRAESINPTFTGISLTQGQSIPANTITPVTCSGVTDNTGVIKAEIFIDNTLDQIVIDPTSAFNFDLDTTGLSSGSHQVKVTVYDAAMNEASITRTVNVGTPPTTYTLNVTAAAGGMIVQPGTNPTIHNAGAVVTIQAQATSGYTFSAWTGDTGHLNGNMATTTVNMNANVTLQATFSPVGPPNLLANGGFESGATGWTQWANDGWGSGNAWDYNNTQTGKIGTKCLKLSITNGSKSFGVYQQVAVTPGATYRVDAYWKGTKHGTDNWYEVMLIDGAFSLTQADTGDFNTQVLPNFMYGYDSHTYPIPGDFGWLWTHDQNSTQVDPNNYDGERTATGSTMTVVLKAGACCGTSNATLYVDGVSLVEVTGAPVTRTLTTSTSAGGTVTVPGIGAYAYNDGAAATITASANVGYHFTNWTGTAVTAAAVANPNAASTNVTMNADYTVQANFEADAPAGMCSNNRVTNPQFGTGSGWTLWAERGSATPNYASTSLPTGGTGTCVQIDSTSFNGGIWQALSLVQGQTYSVAILARDVGSDFQGAWAEMLISTQSPTNGADYNGSTPAGTALLLKWDSWSCDNWNGDENTACVAKVLSFQAPAATTYLVLKCGQTGSKRVNITWDNVEICGPAPATPAPVLQQAVSVKTHGSAGLFGVPLGVAPSLGDTECRANGTTRIEVTFDQAILPADGLFNAGDEVNVTANPGGGIAITNLSVVSGIVLRIDLGGTPNRCALTVTLRDIASDNSGIPGLSMAQTVLYQRVLLCDTTNNARVTSADANKTIAQFGQVTAGNFRADANLDGMVNEPDVNLAKGATHGVVSPAP